LTDGAAPMTLEALVFDFDGTIADTEETHRQAFNHAFVRFGVGWEWTKPLYRELLRVSGGVERLAHFIGTLALPETEAARLLACVPAMHAEKTRVYADLVADGRCPLRPGIARIVDEATRDRIALAIASTSSAASVDALLGRHLGAGRTAFAAIACGDYVGHKKPAPDIYRLALAMLGRRAGECVAFEDSVNGVRAAKRAGLFTVATPSAWTIGEAFEDADLVLPHLGDAGRPLPGPAAALLGARWLDIESLRALHARAVQTALSGGTAA
jgi:HAD superfamily hydrolase (TIGR01509 family)